MKRLESLADPDAVAGMARFGINTRSAYGIALPTLRKIAKEIGRDHGMAQQLWASGVRDARLLACFVDDPSQVTEEQMETWVRDFDSWDICDGCCGHLFDRTEFANKKAMEWSRRPEEFVKRAGFVLMAALAVHDKKAEDKTFLDFLPVIKRESGDDRNLVRKAVNWALRQIGKRNLRLNRAAVHAAEEIAETGSKSGRWIASDAIRELTQEKVQERLRRRQGR